MEIIRRSVSVFEDMTELTAMQLFRLEDRKHAKYLLSPTHEEEITTLVGDIVKSYKDLPLRLYQIC